jgi:hypothetical protein
LYTDAKSAPSQMSSVMQENRSESGDLAGVESGKAPGSLRLAAPSGRTAWPKKKGAAVEPPRL